MVDYKKILKMMSEESSWQIIHSKKSEKEMKETIINIFKPYFENSEVLEKIWYLLTAELINFEILKKDDWYFKKIEKCLITFRKAKAKNAETSYKSCAVWVTEIQKQVSEYWSILNLVVDKDNLSNEDFLHECLRNIGGLIEGVIKPYLKILYHQLSISKGAEFSIDEINSRSLGFIINELIRYTDYPDLFSLPNDIKINQWRNIAYHHQAKVEKGSYLCWYNESKRRMSIYLSKSDLLDVLTKIKKILLTLKMTHTIFFLDNKDEITKYTEFIDYRKESKFIDIASMISSFGFEILDFRENSKQSHIFIKDVTTTLPLERLPRVSKFILLLWDNFPSDEIIIDYYDIHGVLQYRLISNSMICSKILNGELNELELPKTVKIIRGSSIKPNF